MRLLRLSSWPYYAHLWPYHTHLWPAFQKKIVKHGLNIPESKLAHYTRARGQGLSMAAPPKKPQVRAAFSAHPGAPRQGNEPQDNRQMIYGRFYFVKHSTYFFQLGISAAKRPRFANCFMEGFIKNPLKHSKTFHLGTAPQLKAAQSWPISAQHWPILAMSIFERGR